MSTLRTTLLLLVSVTMLKPVHAAVQRSLGGLRNQAPLTTAPPIAVKPDLADLPGNDSDPLENPYSNIHYPVSPPEQQLCHQTLAGFATRRDELGRALASALDAVAAVDREFLSSCDPAYLRSSEHADCLLAFRLKRDQCQRVVADQREVLERLTVAEAEEQARCAQLPREAVERQRERAAATAVSTLPTDPTEIERALYEERLFAFCREIERQPDLLPAPAVSLVGSAIDLERILESFDEPSNW